MTRWPREDHLCCGALGHTPGAPSAFRGFISRACPATPALTRQLGFNLTRASMTSKGDIDALPSRGQYLRHPQVSVESS